MFIEKRENIRIPLTYVTVEVYSALHKMESSETCLIVDMSVSGIGLLSKNLYKISQPILVIFVLPESTIPIHANAVVIYQLPRNSLYHTGVQFTNISLAEFALMKKYVELQTKMN